MKNVNVTVYNINDSIYESIECDESYDTCDNTSLFINIFGNDIEFELNPLLGKGYLNIQKLIKDKNINKNNIDTFTFSYNVINGNDVFYAEVW